MSADELTVLTVRVTRDRIERKQWRTETEREIRGLWRGHPSVVVNRVLDELFGDMEGDGMTILHTHDDLTCEIADRLGLPSAEVAQALRSVRSWGRYEEITERGLDRIMRDVWTICVPNGRWPFGPDWTGNCG